MRVALVSTEGLLLHEQQRRGEYRRGFVAQVPRNSAAPKNSADPVPHPAPQKLQEEDAEEEVWEDQRRERFAAGSGKLSASSSASFGLSNVSSKQAQQQPVSQQAQEEHVGSGNLSGAQGTARGVAIVVSNSLSWDIEQVGAAAYTSSLRPHTLVA